MANIFISILWTVAAQVILPHSCYRLFEPELTPRLIAGEEWWKCYCSLSMAADRGQGASGSSLPAHPAGPWRRAGVRFWAVPMQEFAPLGVPNYHHISLNWPAQAKLAPGHGIKCPLPPWWLGRWGLWWEWRMGCVTLRERHKRRDYWRWIMLEGREG